MKKVIIVILLWVIFLHAAFFEDLGIKLNTEFSVAKEKYATLKLGNRPGLYYVLDEIVIGNIPFTLLIINVKDNKITNIALYKHSPKFRDVVKIYNALVEEYGEPNAFSSVTGGTWRSETVEMGYYLQIADKKGDSEYACVTLKLREKDE